MEQTTDRRRLTAALDLNIAIVLLELYSAVLCFQQLENTPFLYYTEDSNLLGLLSCAIMACYQLRALRTGGSIPVWATVLKYMAVCCLTQTFVIVLFVLGPMEGGIAGIVRFMTDGVMLYHHLLCPVLILLSFLFVEREPLPGRAVSLAMIPTLLYAAVLIVLNLLRVVVGPYPFLRVYEQSFLMSCVWFVVVVGCALLLAWLLARLRRKLGE